jgi:hypothetical protein
MIEPEYYANFGGTEIRAGEGPDIIGVLETSDGRATIGMALKAGWTPQGLARFRLLIGRTELPGRWVCLNRRFVRAEASGI